MKYRTRRYFTESDKALMWVRWQKGESLKSIACHAGPVIRDNKRKTRKQNSAEKIARAG